MEIIDLTGDSPDLATPSARHQLVHHFLAHCGSCCAYHSMMPWASIGFSTGLAYHLAPSNLLYLHHSFIACVSCRQRRRAGGMPARASA